MIISTTLFPTDKPIIGRDLETFRRIMNATVSDAVGAFRINTPTRWYIITRQRADEPVTKPIAILLRWYVAYPKYFPYQSINMTELRKKLKLSHEQFTHLFGRTKQASAAWEDETNPKLPEPVVIQIAQFLKELNSTSKEFATMKKIADCVWETHG